MTYSRFSFILGAMSMLCIAGLSPVVAQPTASDKALRLIASRSVSMPESAFEVSSTEAVLTVLRVNSTMNASTHQGRNNEASAIAKALVSEFKRKGARYSTIQSISVEYVDRAGKPAEDKVIDRIDFRKNSSGIFELHIT